MYTVSVLVDSFDNETVRTFEDYERAEDWAAEQVRKIRNTAERFDCFIVENAPTYGDPNNVVPMATYHHGLGAIWNWYTDGGENGRGGRPV